MTITSNEKHSNIIRHYYKPTPYTVLYTVNINNGTYDVYKDKAQGSEFEPITLSIELSNKEPIEDDIALLLINKYKVDYIIIRGDKVDFKQVSESIKNIIENTGIKGINIYENPKTYTSKEPEYKNDKKDIVYPDIMKLMQM